MNVVADMVQRCIDENARIAQDQTEYEKRYNALAERFDGIKARLDEAAWQALIDYVAVFGRGDVSFTFKNGTEIKIRD